MVNSFSITTNYTIIDTEELYFKLINIVNIDPNQYMTLDQSSYIYDNNEYQLVTIYKRRSEYSLVTVMHYAVCKVLLAKLEHQIVSNSEVDYAGIISAINDKDFPKEEDDV